MQAKGIYFSSFSFCPIQPFNRLDDAYLYWWGWSFFLSLPIQMLISSRNILTGTSKNICSLLVQSSWHIKLPIIVHVWLSLHVSNPISLWSSLFRCFYLLLCRSSELSSCCLSLKYGYLCGENLCKGCDPCQGFALPTSTSICQPSGLRH